MKKIDVGIIGYGNLGALVAQYLSENPLLNVFACDKKADVHNSISTTSKATPATLDKICSCQYIIIAVQAYDFHNLLQIIKDKISPSSIVIGTFSMMRTPEKMAHEILPKNICYLPIHPMFGPSAYRSNGNSFKGFKIVVPDYDKLDASTLCVLHPLCEQFKKLQLNVIQAIPNDHDRITAATLVLHNFIGQSLIKFGIQPDHPCFEENEIYQPLQQVCKAVKNSGLRLLGSLHIYNKHADDIISFFLQTMKESCQELRTTRFKHRFIKKPIDIDVQNNQEIVLLFLGHVLKKMSLEPEIIDTLNYKRLLEFSKSASQYRISKADNAFVLQLIEDYCRSSVALHTHLNLTKRKLLTSTGCQSTTQENVPSSEKPSTSIRAKL